MLKTPLSPQPCSSSPIRERSASAESVVLPVPDSPKKIATWPCVVDVRRAMHREDALERQPIVHHREDRLLDLTCVVGAADEQLGAAWMQDDECAAACAVLLGIRLQVGRVQHDSLRRKGSLLFGTEIDEHRASEERVVRVRRDHAHADPMRAVGSRPGVDDVERFGGCEVRRDLVPEQLVVILGELLVDVSPPDAIGGGRFVDEELVLGRAAGEGAGVDDERAAFGELALAARQRVRVEQCGGRVSIDGAGCVDPLLGEIDAARELSRGHPKAPPSTCRPRTGAWYGLRRPRGVRSATRRCGARARVRRPP